MMGAVLPVNIAAPRLSERFGPQAITAAPLIAGGGCVGLFGVARYTGYAAMAMQLVAWAAIWDFWFLRAPPRRSAV
jgi:DHA2 family methylenomycin A resistance protein-like MFS transporter